MNERANIHVSNCTCAQVRSFTWRCIFLAGVILLLTGRAFAAGTFIPAGSLNIARVGHTANLLQDGTVLVAGGGNGATLSSAEVYNPKTRQWTLVGSMAAVRSLHTGTLLQNGFVLVTGGLGNSSNVVLNSAELYDPAAKTWHAAASLSVTRTLHTATLLQDGRVLVAGGEISYTTQGTYTNACELYDPKTNRWSTVGSLAIARMEHTATLLPSGKVLVVGGLTSGSTPVGAVELFDPATLTWSTIGSITAKRFHTATLLADGTVLIAGGNEQTALQGEKDTEIYDPAAGFSTAGSLATGRFWHSATLLPSGKVIVIGGESNQTFINSTEVYNRTSRTWSTDASGGGTVEHTATLLADGTVLVAGGSAALGQIAAAYLYVDVPIINSPLSVTGGVNVPFNYTITASSAPTSFAATGLPAGLTLNTSTGVISGTPSTSGTATITLSATNAAGTGTATLSLTVAVATPGIVSPLSKIGVVGQPFSYTIISAGNSPFTFTASPLPAGLTFGGAVISGIPNFAGTTNVTLTAQNNIATDSKTLVVTVYPAGYPLITSPLTVTTTVNTPFTYAITASGSGPPAVTATGLPTSLSFAGNTISGTFKTSGQVHIALSATNALGSDNQTLLINVLPVGAPLIGSPLTASAQVGVPFTYTITAPTALTFAAAQLPSWLHLDGAVLSGTPADSDVGTDAVILQAANLSSIDTETLLLSVLPATPAPTVLAIIPDRNPTPTGVPVNIFIKATNQLQNPNYTYSTYVYDVNGTQVGSPLPGNPVTITFPTEGTFFLGAQVGDNFHPADQSDLHTQQFEVLPLAPNTASGVQNVAASTVVSNPVDQLGITISSSASGVVALDIANVAPRDAGEIYATTINARQNTSTTVVLGAPSGAFVGPLTADKFTKAGIYLIDTVRLNSGGAITGHAQRMIPVSTQETTEPSSVSFPPDSDRVISLVSLRGKFKFTGSGKTKAISEAGTRAAGATSGEMMLSCTVKLPGGFDLTQNPRISVGIGNIIEDVVLTHNGTGTGNKFKNVSLKFKTEKTTKTTTTGTPGRISLRLSSATLPADGLMYEGITDVPTAKLAAQRNIQVALVIGGVSYFLYAQTNYSVSNDTGTLANSNRSR